MTFHHSQRTRSGGSRPSVGANELIGFELRWCRCGGGPAAELAERFGLDDRAYFGRVLDELTVHPPAPIRPEVVEEMKAVARRRLWLAGR